MEDITKLQERFEQELQEQFKKMFETSKKHYDERNKLLETMLQNLNTFTINFKKEKPASIKAKVEYLRLLKELMDSQEENIRKNIATYQKQSELDFQKQISSNASALVVEFLKQALERRSSLPTGSQPVQQQEEPPKELMDTLEQDEELQIMLESVEENTKEE